MCKKSSPKQNKKTVNEEISYENKNKNTTLNKLINDLLTEIQIDCRDEIVDNKDRMKILHNLNLLIALLKLLKFS